MLSAAARGLLLGGAGQLNRNFFDLVERDAVAGAVVELGRSRAFVGGDLLGLFECPAVFEVGGDASSSECVITNRCRKSGSFHPAFDHRQDVGSVERSIRDVATSIEGSEEGRAGQVIALGRRSSFA